MRHGKAEDPAIGKPDHQRALLDKGLKQATLAARILEKSGHVPDIVLSSPYLRTLQTARQFTRTAGIAEPVCQDWLASGMQPPEALSELTAFATFDKVMLVGHEPDLSQLIEYTLGISGGGVEMRKGSLCGLWIDPPSRRSTLSYLLPYYQTRGIHA